MRKRNASTFFVSTVFLIWWLTFPISSVSTAPSDPGSQEPVVNYLFRDTFYAPPSLKLKYDVLETNDFLILRDAKRGRHSELAVVSGFQAPVFESRVLKNVRTVDEAKQFLEKNTRKIFFERIPIREVPLLSKDGAVTPRFWVGQRAFDSLEMAQAKIVEVKTAIETNGGNFERSLELISEFFPESPEPTAEEIQARYKSEEELVLKMLDWLEVGESYGPLNLVPGHLRGTSLGEPITWQSFGETTFRWTNLDRAGFNDQVGFWTNRVVFKGIRFIGEPTIDPYVEAIGALESQGANFPKHLDLVAGLEYRPFGRVAFFENFNFEGLYLLKFVRNFRFYLQYMERKNLSDEILNSPDTDIDGGMDVYYEIAQALDSPWVVRERPRGLVDLIDRYVWGEYFGHYYYRKTNFSAVDGYNAWIYNSSLILGIKGPSFALPRNPINDEFLLMPYIRLEHVTVPRRSDLSYDNRIFVAAGIRWMPFRSYQFEHNEWLFKTRIFGEYVGLGGVHHPGGANPDDIPNRDWRAGVAISYNRY